MRLSDILPFLIPLIIVQLGLLAYTLHHIFTILTTGGKPYAVGHHRSGGMEFVGPVCYFLLGAERRIRWMYSVFSHVRKSFGSRQVLKDLTFRVPEHSIYALSALTAPEKPPPCGWPWDFARRTPERSLSVDRKFVRADSRRGGWWDICRMCRNSTAI